MNRILLSLIPLTMVACASTSTPPTNDATVAAAKDDVICEREIHTGTSLPTKHYRSAQQREADRRAVEELEANTRSIRSSQPGKSGS